MPNGTVQRFPAYGKVVDIIVKSDENTLYVAGYEKSLEIEAVDSNGQPLGYKYILAHIEDALVEKYDPSKNNIIHLDRQWHLVEITGIQLGRTCIRKYLD